jgi:hypothetical protein
MKYKDIIQDLENLKLDKYALWLRKIGTGYDEVGRNIKDIHSYDFGEEDPFDVMEEAFKKWGDPNPRVKKRTALIEKNKYKKQVGKVTKKGPSAIDEYRVLLNNGNGRRGAL